MTFSRGMFWGGLFGAAMGIAATIFSVFQYDSEKTTFAETAAVGLLIGLPITAGVGVLVGWLWDMYFGTRRAPPPAAPESPRQPGKRSRK